MEEFIFLFDSDTLNGSPIVKVTYMPVDFIDGIEVSDQSLGKFLGTGTFLRNGDDEFYRLSKRVNRKLYNEIAEKYTDVYMEYFSRFLLHRFSELRVLLNTEHFSECHNLGCHILSFFRRYSHHIESAP